MQSRRDATGAIAGTTCAMPAALRYSALAALLWVMVPMAGAQKFTAAPVVFAPSGSNTVQTQAVPVTLVSASTISSISIPIGFVSAPEFTLADQGGCVEDGVTVNAAGTVCNLVVRFRPAAAGLRQGSLVITDGSGHATAIGLTGVGYYPQVAIAPAAMKIVAGLGPSAAGLSGDGNIANAAALNLPLGMAADSFGNVYVADSGNNVVRMLDAFGNITTVAGGGTVAGARADGGPALLAKLNAPAYVAVDAAGNLYISDTGNNVVRRVAMSTDRTITTVAGTYTAGFSGDGGAASLAQLSNPQGIVLDGLGNLYIVDSGNQRVREVDTKGAILTFAGSGSAGFDAGLVKAGNARFSSPSGLAIDAAGALYLADTGNHAVRRIAGLSVSVIAGTGTSGNMGDGAAATAATLMQPAGVAVSAGGDLYIADSGAGVIRKVQAADGVIETIAGAAKDAGGYTAIVGPATSTIMNGPVGLAFDTQQNLYIADSGNNVVREVSTAPGELLFSARSAGTSSLPVVMKIANIGNAPLTILSVTANGGTATNFVLANSATTACSAAVAAGSHCEYTVTFSPAATTTAQGEIDVTSVADNPNFTTVSPVFLSGGLPTSLTIAPGALNAATVAQAYSAAITASGGYGAVTVTTSGSLPAGITATANGTVVTLSGAPTSPGTTTFVVYASDQLGNNVSQSYTLQALLPSLTYTLTETIHITDAPTALPLLQYSLLETVHVSDAPAYLLPLVYALTETVHVADTPSNLPGLVYGVLETVHVSDVPTSTASLAYAVTETIHVTDAPSGTPALLYAVLETVHVSDVPTSKASLAYAVTETIHVTDAPSGIPALLYAVLETVHVSDVPTSKASLAYAVMETIHVTDAPSGTPALLYAVLETVHVSDVPTSKASLAYAVTETIHVTDAPSGTPALLYSVLETVHVSDTPASTASLAYAVTETIHVTDAPSGTAALLYALTETVHVSDTPQVAPGAPLSLSPGAGALTAGVVNIPYGGATIRISGGVGTVKSTVSGTVPGLVFTASSGGLTVSGTPTTAGSYSFTVSVTDQLGDAASQTYLILVAKQVQTITAPGFGGHMYGDAAFGVTATSTSGLPVTIAVASGPATFTSGVLDLTGVGVVTLNFSQPGDANTTAATTVTRMFGVAPAVATITAQDAARAFESPNPAFKYAVTGLVRTETIAVLSGAPVLTTKAVLNSPSGTYPITAAQGTLTAANYTFNFVPGTLTITGHIAQTITFSAIPNVPLAVGTLTLTAHSTSSLAVAYAVVGPATITGNQLHVTGTGTVTVTASQTGNTTFDAATPVSRSFTVTP